MVEILVVDDNRHNQSIREIFWEYLQWINERVAQEYGISFDIAAILEHDMLDLGIFMPPKGILLLGTVDNHLAGVSCLKALGDCCGEVKRMYVRPDSRRLGLGRALLERLLTEAARIGYNHIRLDSARFMVSAHQLYRSLGFQDIEPYEGSEVPPEFRSNWVFMQKDLSPVETNPATSQ
jgi:GNAT superfamily N-acetyltransferase